MEKACQSHFGVAFIPPIHGKRGDPWRDIRYRKVGRYGFMLSLLAASIGMASMAYANGAPSGGQIVSGVAHIQQSGSTTTIRQSSQTLSLNWQSFDIAPDQTVNFLQPDNGAVAVNRVFSSTPSDILGHLNANGQVWLINPNGVLFGQGAQVNVAGLVASTLDVDGSTLDAAQRRFSGAGNGRIVNRGALTAADGGYVALLGNQVSNQGVIRAQLGTVALAGGSAVTLTFAGHQLVHMQVDRSTLNNLAENRQLIVADGGRVVMTAGARDALLGSVVNNTGVVRAQSVQNHDGTITLLGGMAAGQVQVGGTLDASAPQGGHGGAIETSAAHFQLAGDAHITAAAPRGSAGSWLIDPTDLTIDSTAATTISSTLNGGTNVTETTTASSATGVGTQSPGNGDINVDAAVSWTNPSATLTLQAYNAISLNAPIHGAGKVMLNAGGAVGGDLTIAAGASIIGGAGVTLATANRFINNGGAAAISTGTSAPWLIYSAAPTQDSAGGLSPGFIQYNAPYPTTPAVSGNGFLYSLAPMLNVGLTGSVSKTYDGTTAVVPGLDRNNITVSGLVNGDQLASASATGTYASADTGSVISVTASNIQLTCVDAGGLVPVYGYQFAGTAAGAIGAINPKPLSASVVGNPTKVYDGTTTATLTASNYLISGFVGSQGATVSQPESLAYDAPDAGARTVDVTFHSQNFAPTGGTNLADYILPTSATGPGTIAQAPVWIRGLLADDKTYDGSTAATLAGATSLYGVIGSDAVQLDATSATGAFATANAGNHIAVLVGGFQLTGAQALDYQLVAPNLTANIRPKTLTVSGVTATSKTYDGTANDTLDVGSAALVGIVGGDNVSLVNGAATGTFSQSNVGDNLAVTASGFSLGGSAAGNYTLTLPTGLAADITPAQLAIAFNGNPTKIYDGTNAATLNSADFTITGLVGNESLAIVQAPASYATANAGTGIAVTTTLQPSDFSSGTTLANYVFNSSVTGTGTITPAPLTVQIVNNPTKVFDGTTSATLDAGNFSLYGLINGESIALNAPAAGNYASPSAGIEDVSAALTAANFTAGSGTLLSNYLLPTVANGLGTITPKAVGVSINAAITGNPSRVYDGSTAMTLDPSQFTLTGFVNGDSAVVNKAIAGTFGGKNVGAQPLTATLQESDFDFTGSDENNYSFPVTAFGTGTITPAPLTVSIIGNPTKVYDGTTNTYANLKPSDFQINGFVSGEGASISPTTAFNYATANAGSSITISGALTVNNFMASGATLLSNYTLPTSAAGAGTITQAPLYVTGVYATSRPYDTTNIDMLNVGAAALAGLVSSDVGQVTLTSPATGTFAQVNVGSHLAVTAGAFSISGAQAANYVLSQPTGMFADITPKTVTVTGISANSRDFDGTTTATLTLGGYALSGVYPVDQPNVALGTSYRADFSTPNAGNAIPVTVSGLGLSGTQASNYALQQPAGLSANITPAPLTVTITGFPTKPYDGSSSVTLQAADYTLTINGGQVVTDISIPQTASANYASPNAGTQGITAQLVTSDFQSGNGDNLSNYVLPSTAAGSGAIVPYVLNLSAARSYDGSALAAGSQFGTLNGLNGDTLVVNGAGATGAKDVGSYTNGAGGLDISGLTLAAAGGSSAIASNYTLVGGTDSFVIKPFVLNLNGTRVYDRTTAADGAAFGTLQGAGSETLTLTGSGVTRSKQVGSYASGGSNGLDVSGLSLVGGGSTDASDYTLVGGSDTFTITPLALTLDAPAVNKIYDATTGATATVAVDPSGRQVYGGDQISFTVGSASFVTANAGSGITVTANGITASGADAADYSFNTSAQTTADILPRPLDLSGTRVYDGGTDANGQLFGTVSGLNGDSFTLSGSGALNSKQVGTYSNAGGSAGFSPGTLQLLALGGANAGNYTLVGGVDQVTVTPLSINVGAVANDKVYDGTTNATLRSLTSSGVIAGDDIRFADTAATFVDPNAAAGIQVDVTGISATGADAADYRFNTAITTTADITPRPLVLTGQRVYDGGTDADASLFTSNGVIATGIGNQALTLAGTGVVASKNAGSQRALQSLGTLALADDNGALASNYTLSPLTGDWVTITPLTITVSATGRNKIYDGTATATVALAGHGVLPGDSLHFSAGSADFRTPNVGNGVPISVTGITGSGADAGNYVFNTAATTSAAITPYVLNLTGTRVYDADTDASASLFGDRGLLAGVNGETLTLNGAGALVSKDVGTQRGFLDLGTLVLSNGSGLASNYTLDGGIDWVTITPHPIVVSATGTSRRYNSQVGDLVTLTATGVLPGDELSFIDSSATFGDPYVGDDKTVTVRGITAIGPRAGDYFIVDPVTTTLANITGDAFAGVGLDPGLIAQLQAGLQSTPIATPYGSADMDTAGVYHGNHELRHRPVQRNRERADFRSGLSLRFQNGGVRLPPDALP